MMEIIKDLNWRYAVKKFDKNKIVDDETLNTILESVRLSPSSYGLQPWKFVIVKNKEIREKLKGAAYNQSQVTDASHLIVFAVRKDINEAFVDSYLKSISKTRHIDVESLSSLGNMIKGSIKSQSSDEHLSWSTHQVYLALGVFLTSCAIEGIDTCPMEGFDKKKFDEILNFKSLNLESRAVVAVGFRSDSDISSDYLKVRFPKEEVFIEIN